MKLGLCRAPSCASVSFTVAIALSCQIAVRTYRDEAKAVFAPKLWERIETIAKAFRAKAVRWLRLFRAQAVGADRDDS